MPVLWKTQGEEDAGRGGANVIEEARPRYAIYRVTQGLNCSSF